MEGGKKKILKVHFENKSEQDKIYLNNLWKKHFNTFQEPSGDMLSSNILELINIPGKNRKLLNP